MHVVTSEQRAFYESEGYLCLRGVIPAELVNLGKRILEKWVDKQVAQWHTEGRIDERFEEVDFNHRLNRAWSAAGKPKYSRSPRHALVSPDMFAFLGHPVLVDVAEDLLGSCDVLAHGIFNARPKLPDQLWTDTPWHQDAQYYRDAQHVHVVSMWLPLVPVTEHNSCLQVAPRMHRGKLFDAAKDVTGFIGLSKEEREHLNGVSIEMEPGDLLCFPALTPHRALANRSDAVRWSMDVRFECAVNATQSGLTHGFVARSGSGEETPCEEWLAKWDGMPANAY